MDTNERYNVAKDTHTSTLTNIEAIETIQELLHVAEQWVQTVKDCPEFHNIDITEDLKIIDAYRKAIRALDLTSETKRGIGKPQLPMGKWGVF